MINSNKSFNFLIWLGIFSVSTVLIIYAYLGIFTRYMADDYCLLVNLYSADVFTASWNKYLSSSNRFSNLFIISLWGLFPKNTAFVPALHIVLWTFGLSWLFYEINRFLNLQLKPPLFLLIAEVIILFTFYTSPNIFQILYWRPGQVTYLTSLVLFTLVFAWVLRIINSHTKINLLFYIPLFSFVSFFIGGLSETVNTLHLALLFLVIVTIFFLDKSPSRTLSLSLLSSLFTGTFVALIAMFFAPANALRINSENLSPNLFEVITRSWEYTYAFLLGAFKSLPVPLMALIIISASLAYFFFLQHKTILWTPNFTWVFLFIPLLTYLFVFVTFAPSAYGQSYPVERVRFPAHLTLTIALITLSICIGYVLSYIKLPTFLYTFVFVITCVTLFYPFWMARQPLQTYEFRRLWSKRWDEREIIIQNLIVNGETELIIPGLDGYEGTKELDGLPTYWANVCAAQYYGVKTIQVFSVREENIHEFFSE